MRTGKTGADAMFFAIKLTCGTLKRYQNKFIAVARLAESNGVINTTELAIVENYVTSATQLCAVLELVAGFSSIT